MNSAGSAAGRLLLLGVACGLAAAPGGCACGQEPAIARGIRIHTDELHVAHVFAETDAGVFRGLGFAQVRDFPVATLANLWSASGRFAEVVGPSVLARDERIRQWGIDRRAHELALDPDELEAEAKGWLEAYIAGVNAGRRLWLETPDAIAKLVGAERELGFDPVPPWLHPLHSKDDPRARLTRLFEAEVGLEHVLAFGIALAAGPEFGGAGSATRTNAWLMRGGAGDPTTRLLADVHQPLQEFGYRSYFVQLAGPRYDLVGLSAPGFPCIVLGANRAVAFASMTLPKKPRELLEAELPFRLEERLPRVADAWSGRLEPDAPARLVRGEETLALREQRVTLRAFDLAQNALVDDPRGELTLRWLRDEALGLELPVLEPGPQAPLDLAARPTLRFEARSFLGQRSLWESWMRLGLCTRVQQGEAPVLRALEREWLTFGRGQSCLFGDGNGDFLHLWSVRAPRLGAAGRARAGDVLDGNDPAQAWLGFHGLADLPRVAGQGSEGGKGGAWILCNSSPEFVVPGRALGSPAVPDICDGEPWKTLRQDRARELFERVNADGIHAPAELERMALDVQDQWSRANWPWIRALADDQEQPLSARARAFVEWIERFRFEGLDGKPGAAEAFLAHPTSQVMPFLVLIRDRSEDELLAAQPASDALALAFDPCFVAPTPAAFLGEERFATNRAALRAAVEWAAELRAKTLEGAPGGLVNTRFLVELGQRWKSTSALFPGAFDALLARAQAPEWGEGAPPVALRWGEVNVFALTPHRSSVDPGLDNAYQVEGWLAALFAPSTVVLDLPFFRRQPAIVFPIGGTHDSLFQVHHESFRSYARSLIPRGEDRLALAPVDFGSQALLLIELRAGERPRVRVLPALGATEVTAAVPELGFEALAPYRVTARFMRGEWSTLETDEGLLEGNTSVHTIVLDE